MFSVSDLISCSLSSSHRYRISAQIAHVTSVLVRRSLSEHLCFMEICRIVAKNSFMTFLRAFGANIIDLCAYFCPWMSSKAMQNTSDVESVHQDAETLRIIRAIVVARGADGATLREIKRE